MREGGREGRRLVTGVRSGWGRASRSMRTKYHICQQFVVEFGRVSVITDALLGEALRDARLLADSKTIPSTPACIQSLRIAIQWFIVLDTELAVRAGAYYVRYRRARLPPRRPLLEFPQRAIGEVLCRVNPIISNSVSHACHLQYVLLSSCALSSAEINGGIHCGLLSCIQCGVCVVASTVDLQIHIFNLLSISLSKLRILESTFSHTQV